MSGRLDEIHHVAVQVDDIDEAIRWYQDHMRCEVEYRDETWGLLRLANLKLALVVKDQHPPHLAVAVEDADRYGRLVMHRDGTASCYISDPSGNVLEMLQA